MPELDTINGMRNRILGHKIVRVRDIDPHELNPRVHTQDQRDAIQAIWKEVGFARSLLCYVQRNGRLKLIDGHLRTSELNPDDEIEVEILDVDDDEARKLLLTIDPLASLATYSDSALLKLKDLTKTDDATLNALWSTLHQTEPIQIRDEPEKQKAPTASAQWLVIITCNNESDQATKLADLQLKGYNCKAVTS